MQGNHHSSSASHSSCQLHRVPGPVHGKYLRTYDTEHAMPFFEQQTAIIAIYWSTVQNKALKR